MSGAYGEYLFGQVDHVPHHLLGGDATRMAAEQRQ